MEKTGSAILQLVTLGGLFMWILIDAFRIPSMVSNHNLEITDDINRVKLSKAQSRDEGE